MHRVSTDIERAKTADDVLLYCPDHPMREQFVQARWAPAAAGVLAEYARCLAGGEDSARVAAIVRDRGIWVYADGGDEIMAERYDDVLRPVAWLPMAAFQQADVAGADHG